MSASDSTMSEAESLRPTPDQHRVFTTVSYVLTWWSSLIVIQAFALGQGFLPPIGKMNLYQAGLVMVIAVVLFVVMFSLNGQAGLKYGIPYSIQARAGFGTHGSKAVEFLRAIPAIVWYGIGTWIAALSLDGILTQLTGITAPAAKYVYFVALQVLQTVLAYRGIRTMKWFNSSGSIVIAAIMLFVAGMGLQVSLSGRRVLLTGAHQDARAARTRLRDLARIKDSEMLLMGESLGDAIVVQLAAESAGGPDQAFARWGHTLH